MQIVIISGKGGTGKTTLAASFATLAGSELIKVDCDVDASNLHLMFGGTDFESAPFVGAKLAVVDRNACTLCKKCIDTCRYNAIDIIGHAAKVNALKCEGCGACTLVCPQGAIVLEDEVTGDTILTRSEQGVISRAEMIPGAEGSGKLVTQVRKNAKAYAGDEADFIIDGSPGVGCSVMASITGCDYGVIVTEPTLSGYADFKRVLKLTEHFGLRPATIINKYDINPEISDQIESFCSQENIKVIGKVPFDDTVKQAINEGIPVSEYAGSSAGQAIVQAWNTFKKYMEVEND